MENETVIKTLERDLRTKRNAVRVLESALKMARKEEKEIRNAIINYRQMRLDLTA